MASTSIIKILPIILLFSLITTVNSTPENELNTMLTVLRSRGYNLFANAITTSDIYYDVISGSNFTFFAPIDSALFALDMTTAASDYVTTLRLHVVPRRFSLSDLRRIRSGSSLSTLMPGQNVVIERQRTSPVITVDGVEIVVPGLFYERDIAVHGLEGILSFRSRQANFTGNHSFQPPTTANFSNNHTHALPPANFPGNNGINSNTVVFPPEISPASLNSPAPSLSSTVLSPTTFDHSGSSRPMLSLTSPANSPEMMVRAVLETVTMVDEKTVDCPLTDEKTDLNDVSVRHGYFYTREHYTVSTMTCGQQ